MDCGRRETEGSTRWTILRVSGPGVPRSGQARRLPGVQAGPVVWAGSSCGSLRPRWSVILIPLFLERQPQAGPRMWPGDRTGL